MRPVSLPLASVVFAALALASSLPVHATGPCVPSVNTLCLDDVAGDKRFAVKVDYSTTQGGGFVGSGKAVPLNALGVVRGGLFYFFNADNPEILVKIVNGCALNNRFWVYLSAGTNVGFNLTVTDTTYDKSKSYQNPDLLAAQSVNDTASVTCDGSTPPTEPPPTEPPPGDPRWILTTRPGTFFTATAQTPVFQVDIPVSPTIAFYRVVVEVEVDLNGWYEARPTGKHNIFKVWRGSSLDGNLFGDVGILGPSRNELELVSNADLPSGQYEVQSDSLPSSTRTGPTRSSTSTPPRRETPRRRSTRGVSSGRTGSSACSGARPHTTPSTAPVRVSPCRSAIRIRGLGTRTCRASGGPSRT